MQEAKKVALITGANKGIGFEVARQIAENGWTVLAGARNEELGRQAAAKLQAAGLDVHFIHIDLNAQETAVSAAETIRKQFGRLDLLINNAGIAIMSDGPPSKVNIEALETVMHTNYVGTVTVTQAMLPLLQSAGKAQVVNVSSELGSVLDNFEWGEGYSQRFGMVWVDFRDQRRIIKDSGHWYGRMAASNRLDM
jgi:NAD(P)-dependent dehydrogenase (short-subunit alcohol dehydrogenase family)